MAHVVEVDQSWKFENTQQDTVLALANGIRYSILIPAHVKRECIHILRARGIGGPMFYIQLFAISLFFLLKDHIGVINHVYIDKEYSGKEGQIKDYLVNAFRRAGILVSYHQIQFTHVGKKSNAHIVALATLRKEKKANRLLTVEDIVGEFRQKK